MILRHALLRPGCLCRLPTGRAFVRPRPFSAKLPGLVAAPPRLSVAAAAALRPAGMVRYMATSQTRLPERLLIYHAGTPRTTFLACLKLTTLFGFAFFTFLVAPAYMAAEKPWWQVAGVATCGIVPFAMVAYTTAPFVAFIHLRLPPFARYPDRDLLRRFVQRPPAATMLDVTTMNLVGRPRHTAVALADLVPSRERLGIVNVKVCPAVGSPAAAAAATRSLFSRSYPFIHLPPATRFGAPAAGNGRGVRDGWVWDALLENIQAQAKR